MIRKAVKSDIKSLYHLENSVFLKNDFGMSLQSFYYHVQKNPLFVYEIESTIVAYILWLKRKNYYRLYSLCVHNNFQGKGLGKTLLDFSFKELDSSFYSLEVKVSNQAAIGLYEKLGFLTKKRIKNYYPNNIDALVMIRENNVNPL